MLSRKQEKILQYCNITNDLKKVSELSKYDIENVKNEVLTLARKEKAISIEKAKLLLKGDQREKFLNIPFGSQYKGLRTK